MYIKIVEVRVPTPEGEDFPIPFGYHLLESHLNAATPVGSPVSVVLVLEQTPGQTS